PDAGAGEEAALGRNLRVQPQRLVLVADLRLGARLDQRLRGALLAAGTLEQLARLLRERVAIDGELRKPLSLDEALALERRLGLLRQRCRARLLRNGGGCFLRRTALLRDPHDRR